MIQSRVASTNAANAAVGRVRAMCWVPRAADLTATRAQAVPALLFTAVLRVLWRALKIRTRRDDVVRVAAPGGRRPAVAVVYDSVRRRTTVVGIGRKRGRDRWPERPAAGQRQWPVDVQTERQQQQARQGLVERRAKEQPSAAAA